MLGGEGLGCCAIGIVNFYLKVDYNLGNCPKLSAILLGPMRLWDSFKDEGNERFKNE
jgi:hypothetical protein